MYCLVHVYPIRSPATSSGHGSSSLTTPTPSLTAGRHRRMSCCFPANPILCVRCCTTTLNHYIIPYHTAQSLCPPICIAHCCLPPCDRHTAPSPPTCGTTRTTTHTAPSSAGTAKAVMYTAQPTVSNLYPWRACCDPPHRGRG